MPVWTPATPCLVVKCVLNKGTGVLRPRAYPQPTGFGPLEDGKQKVPEKWDPWLPGVWFARRGCGLHLKQREVA